MNRTAYFQVNSISIRMNSIHPSFLRIKAWSSYASDVNQYDVVVHRLGDRGTEERVFSKFDIPIHELCDVPKMINGYYLVEVNARGPVMCTVSEETFRRNKKLK